MFSAAGGGRVVAVGVAGTTEIEGCELLDSGSVRIAIGAMGVCSRDGILVIAGAVATVVVVVVVVVVPLAIGAPVVPLYTVVVG